MNNDQEVRDLLERYQCPFGFHEVRARFMGAIASPAAGVVPLNDVSSLWGGELPPVSSMEEVDAFVNTLIKGLWTRLAQSGLQQEAFELVPFDLSEAEANWQSLRRLCQIRLEEIQGFTDGFFQGLDELNLPAEASHCLNSLSELEEFFVNLIALTEPAAEQDLAALADQIDELSEIATVEINNIMALVAASKAP
jgi:hypothetical protein